MTKDDEILKTKEEMRFYVKEFIKNIIKFPLIFIKRILIITLALCNTIAPIVIILLIPISISEILVIATAFTIANIIIFKKIDNSDIQYENELTETSIKFMCAGYNFIKSGYNFIKLRKNLKNAKKRTQQNNNKVEENEVNSKFIQKSPKVTNDSLAYDEFSRYEIEQSQRFPGQINSETMSVLNEFVEEQYSESRRDKGGHSLVKKRILPKRKKI